jgi:hypothetical protein
MAHGMGSKDIDTLLNQDAAVSNQVSWFWSNPIYGSPPQPSSLHV